MHKPSVGTSWIAGQINCCMSRTLCTASTNVMASPRVNKPAMPPCTHRTSSPSSAKSQRTSPPLSMGLFTTATSRSSATQPG
jgi:hypothetical protein